jgi:hypothetical protein
MFKCLDMVLDCIWHFLLDIVNLAINMSFEVNQVHLECSQLRCLIDVQALCFQVWTIVIVIVFIRLELVQQLQWLLISDCNRQWCLQDVLVTISRRVV